MKKRMIVVWFSVLVVLAAPCLLCAEAAFPAKPIQIWIGYPPGGGIDLLTRVLAEDAKKYLGQEVVVVNKPGAAGTVAAIQVTTAKPDGYILGCSPSNVFTITPFLQDVQVDLLKESTLILSIAKFNVAYFVKANSPFKTLKDFLEYARRNSGANFGTPGTGSKASLAIAAIADREHVKINLIPFPGDIPAVTAVLGGHVMAAGCSPGGWVPQVDAGALRLIAAVEEERIEGYPDCPTVVEMGFPYPMPILVFIHGPKGVPEPIVRKLQEAFEKASTSATFKNVAIKNVMYSNKHISGKELEAFLASEKTKSGEIVQKLGFSKK